MHFAYLVFIGRAWLESPGTSGLPSIFLTCSSSAKTSSLLGRKSSILRRVVFFSSLLQCSQTLAPHCVESQEILSVFAAPVILLALSKQPQPEQQLKQQMGRRT